MNDFSCYRFFIYLFFIIAVVVKEGFAQHPPEFDSLNSILIKTQEDSVRANIYNTFFSYFKQSTPAEALKYADSALFFAKNGNNLKEIAKAYNNIGSIFTEQGQFDSALVYYSLSLENFKTINHKLGIAALFNNIGKVYATTSNYLLALENYQSAIKIFEELNNKEGIASIFNNFSAVFIRQKKHSEAIEYLQKSFSIYEEIGNNYGASHSLTNIGIIYEERIEYDTALEYYHKALENNRKLDNKSGIATNLCYIGNIYHLKRDDITSLKFQKEALKIQQDIGNRHGTALILFSIGEIYKELAYRTEAVLQFSNSVKIAKEVGDKELIKSNYKSLSAIYEEEGDYLQANKYFKLYSDVKDSLLNETTSKQISEIQIKYETEKKEKENKLLKQDNEIQELEIQKEKNYRKFLVTGIISLSLFFIVVLALLLIIRKTNRLLKIQQRELIETNNKLTISENNLMESLAAKDKFFSIISHDLRSPFLSIIGLNKCLKETPSLSNEEYVQLTNELDIAVNRVNTLLENLLLWAKTQTNRILLKKELLHLKTEIENNIQLFLSNAANKKINLHWKIDEISIRFDKNMFDTIIRNLISNAIKFTPQCGEICIYATKKNNEVIIEVKDNGKGIRKDDFHKIFMIDSRIVQEGSEGEKGSGLGLILCKEFVEMNAGSIWVESEFGNGSSFKFTIPLSC